MQFSDLSMPQMLMVVTVAAAIGVAAGPIVGWYVVRLEADRPAQRGMSLALAVGLGLLATSLVMLAGQHIPYVSPDPAGRWGRLVFHGILITLLLAATWYDLRHTEIPDGITLPGMLIGLGASTLSGDLQMIHLWMDWNPVAEHMHGGNVVIPEWIRDHRHWHGLALSAAGLTCGGGLTWIVRLVSGWVLGREALGLGDVTLMAMIGSFMGWQPVLFVFLLAPFCGLLVGFLAKVLANRSYVPYGPFLAAAALVVLLFWRWIWMFPPGAGPGDFAIRHLFGDGLSLAIIAGIALAAFFLLLLVVRLYGAIPTRSRSSRASADAADEP